MNVAQNNVIQFPAYAPSAQVPSTLSPRETELMELLEAQDLSNADLGLALNCSQHTVRAHLRSIFLKLDVQRRREAVMVWGRTLRRAA